MVIMTTSIAHDTQASLPDNAWQDKPTNSKPLCLAASSSIPSTVPNDFISHLSCKPTHLGTLFGHLPAEQHWPGHHIVRDQLSTCALSPPFHRQRGAAVPSCALATHRRSQIARNHPFCNSFLHCLTSYHTPFQISSFLFSRKALPVRGEFFCCFPAGKLRVGTSHSQPEPVRI